MCGETASTAIDTVATETETREQLHEQVRSALVRAARSHGRAAVIVVEVDGNYANKAHERVQKLLAEKRLTDWRGHRSERLHCASLGRNRFALVVAPIGYPAHARALAEQLTRSLDPRICPLLRRALPYAWSGLGVYPDDGVDAQVLIGRAEQALERLRTAGPGCRKLASARRRHLAASLLRPEGAR